MRKIIIRSALGFTFFLGLTFVVLPWFLRNYIENHSEEWTGRKITLYDLDINIFTGGVSADTLIVSEQDKAGIFFKADNIYINLELFKIIFGTYGVSQIEVTNPVVNIIQNRNQFNFDDLTKRITATDSTPKPEKPSNPVEYRLENISIRDGIIRYVNLSLGSEIKLIKLDSSCPQISWDDPAMKFLFDFLFDKGGKMKGDFDLNSATLDYRTRYELDSLNIGIFLPYVRDAMNAGNLNGLVSNHQRMYGNLNRPEALAAAGNLMINKFSLLDPKMDDLVSLEELKITMDTLNVIKELYEFGTISLMKPYLIFELFEEGNNFTSLLKGGPSGIGPSSDSLSTAVAYGNVFALIAESIRQLSQTYAISNYKADSVVLRQSILVFNDYTLQSKFNYLLENLMVKAEGINSENKELRFIASSTLNHSGKLDGGISMDPNGFRNMDIKYSITELKVSDFSPYSNYYVAHPFTDGICTYTSRTSIKDNQLKSNHKLFIRTIQVGDKVKNNTAYHLPIRLAVALLRDKNGDVNLELPIEGSLDDPKFKVGKVLWQVFRNLIGKVAASPGKLLAGKAGVDEKLLSGFSWTTLQFELSDEQKSSLDAMVKAMETTSEIKLGLVNVFNDAREADVLALKAGKKKFLVFNRKITSEDAALPEDERLVDQIHDQDSAFNAYLDNQVKAGGDRSSSIEKAKRLVGEEKLLSQLKAFYEQRNAAVRAYLVEVKRVDPVRFRFTEPKEKTNVPYEVLSRTVSDFYVEDN